MIHIASLDEIVRYSKGAAPKEVEVVLDTSYLKHLPESDYRLFETGIQTKYNYILTKGVSTELHQRGGKQNIPLITEPLKRLIYDKLGPKLVECTPTEGERTVIKYFCEKGCKKARKEKMSEEDIEQVTYAMRAQKHNPIIMLSNDDHIKGTVRAMRPSGYKIYCPN